MLQVRFEHQEDCNRVVQVLRYRGLPFRTSTAKSQSRPGPLVPAFQSDGTRSSSRPTSASLTLPALPVPTAATDRSSSIQAQEVERPIGLPEGSFSASDTIFHSLTSPQMSGAGGRNSDHGLHGHTQSRTDDARMYGSHVFQSEGHGTSSVLRHRGEDDWQRAVNRPLSETASLPMGAGAYSDQPVEVRNARLEEFLIQNLDNPEFTTLCQDVENCWRGLLLHGSRSR